MTTTYLCHVYLLSYKNDNRNGIIGVRKFEPRVHAKNFKEFTFLSNGEEKRLTHDNYDFFFQNRDDEKRGR